MLAAVQYGAPVAQIYRAANNPLVDRMITRFRGDWRRADPEGRRRRAARDRGAAARRASDDARRPEDE